MQQTDEELLRDMYEEYQIVLRKIATNCGVPYSYVDDVVQETFIAYYKNYPLDWEPGQKKAMLARIVKNKSTDFFRKNKNTIYQISMDSEEFNGEADILSKRMMRSALDSILEDENYRELREVIDGMKEEWKDLAMLLFVEGRQVSEVSALLGLSEPACRMRMSRIRKYIKNWLKEREKD